MLSKLQKCLFSSLHPLPSCVGNFLENAASVKKKTFFASPCLWEGEGGARQFMAQDAHKKWEEEEEEEEDLLYPAAEYGVAGKIHQNLTQQNQLFYFSILLKMFRRHLHCWDFSVFAMLWFCMGPEY